MESQSGISRSRWQSLRILQVENDPASAALTREAFKEAGLHQKVVSVRDGDEALAYLRNEQHHHTSSQPDLIFLDLHLPRKSGFEVLEEIKSNPLWTATPIVVVSGSVNPAEVRKAYELHASCYVHKPSDLHEFLRFIRICYEFWGSVVSLPNQQAS